MSDDTTRLGTRDPLGLRVTRAGANVRADLLFAVVDAMLVVSAYGILLLLRFGGVVPEARWEGFGAFLPFALGAHIVANWGLGLYGRLWRHASIQEARRLLLAGAMSGSFLVIVSLAQGRRLPVSVAALGSVVATMLMAIMRFRSRLFAFQRGAEAGGLRVVVIGAGDTGSALIAEMQRRAEAGYVPVAVLDDDSRKRGRSLRTVPVVGDIESLPDVAARFSAHAALFAIPTAAQLTVRRAADAADRARIPLKVVPGVADVVGGRASMRDVRDLRIEDLLGRVEVQTDLLAVRALLSGRRVLITGAGGSIGNEIARQVAECDPAELLLLDHDETHLHDVAASLALPVTQLLVDIRNEHRVMDVFARHRPDVVFHGAAHKHVPLLEAHPTEAVETNVLGTRNVIRACQAAGTGRFVLISTDKAVSPTSVMGASKAVAERLVVRHTSPSTPYCAVRFGNVLGSRGSVIPTFMRQIASGGPVTVTDARMERFFMSITEAVQLVLQAAAMAEGGEIFMLEMGEPVRIIDLAERMIRLSGLNVGTDIEIRVTGVRPGEKLTEELRGEREVAHRTPHPDIASVQPPAIDREAIDEGIARLEALAASRHDDQVRDALFALLTAWQGRSAETGPVDEDGERLIDLTDGATAVGVAVRSGSVAEERR